MAIGPFSRAIIGRKIQNKNEEKLLRDVDKLEREIDTALETELERFHLESKELQGRKCFKYIIPRGIEPKAVHKVIDKYQDKGWQILHFVGDGTENRPSINFTLQENP